VSAARAGLQLWIDTAHRRRSNQTKPES
jgi:hypothetical protein